MYFIDKRIQVICDNLNKLRVRNTRPITDWQYKKGFYLYPAQAEAEGGPWEAFDGNSMHWYGPDEHYWFRGSVTVPQELGGWERYQNKEINNDILISYGYGDGGGGPTREMLETSGRMEQGVRGIPKVRQAFARTFFEELEQRVKDNRRLETWEGEFYFEYHRGTYTSMARNKRANRKSELLLMDLELLSVLAEKALPYPAQELDRMWKTVLLNQFHDILSGSSIHEVYEVTKKEYEELSQTAGALLGERLDAIAGQGEGVTVFNTTGFARSDTVELGQTDARALTDEAGKVFPVQPTAEGSVAFVENLPAKGFKTLRKAGAVPADIPFARRDDHHLETPFYSVTFDEHGHFASLSDKENDRELLQAGKAGNVLRMYEDKPIYYDNWDIDMFYTEKSWPAEELVSMTWTEDGPVRATVELEYKISLSTIRQKIHFYAHSRRIDFVTWVDWKQHQHLLKAEFPVDIHSDEATFEIQFGNLTRKVHSNTSWDKARFEVCGQKWMDFSEGHYGVSLLNDCKYGHSVRDGVIGLTLIKSGIEPNPVADQEEHLFTYALYPHAGTWRDAGTVRERHTSSTSPPALWRGAYPAAPSPLPRWSRRMWCWRPSSGRRTARAPSCASTSARTPGPTPSCTSRRASPKPTAATCWRRSKRSSPWRTARWPSGSSPTRSKRYCCAERHERRLPMNRNLRKTLPLLLAAALLLSLFGCGSGDAPSPSPSESSPAPSETAPVSSEPAVEAPPEEPAKAAITVTEENTYDKPLPNAQVR